MDEFIKEFEQTLVFPTDKKYRIFLCPIGLLGAGKTTVMKPLCERLALLRISSDDIRKTMKESLQYYEGVLELATSLVRKYAEQGYGIGVDSDCANPKKREELQKAAQELGFKVIWIHINPPEEFILNKLKNFRHTWLYRDADHAIKNYYQQKSKHENLNLDFTYTFDTSREDLPRQIDEAVELIKHKADE